MLDQVIILPNDADRASIGSFNDSNVWDLDDDDSFEGDDSSEEGLKQSVGKALENTRLQHTRECIDDALEILTCTEPEKLVERKLEITDLYNSLYYKSDRPPARPRRSFDIGKKHQYREVADEPHDRFELSKSEHTSSSLSPPSFPTRPAHLNGSGTLPEGCEPIKNCDNLRPKRWLLSRTESVRDGGIRPTSLSNEGDDMSRSERGKVTLRVSEERVLRGTRELSTSQHLRRSCPTSRIQSS
jgi:hypothetical protein